ncbi:hypothetical protein [Mesobacillus campisalis]|nr:hypothetical protein [Mesobacillus campisalis]
MKKRTWAILGLSGALLIGSAYSISANTPGYELYKEALKATHQVESSKLNLSFELEDNSRGLFSSEYVMKTDRLANTMIGEGTVSNGLKSSSHEMAKQGGKFLIQKNDEDKIYAMTLTGKHPGKEALSNEELRDDLEGVVDILTKKLQRNIETSVNKDGSQEIALDVPDKEIPGAIDALTSLAYKHSVQMNDRESGRDSGFHDVKPEMPKLEEDIKIKKVKIAASVSAAKIIEKQSVEVALTGKDENGKQHELTMTFQLALSDINSTNVDAMDITGLEIVELQHPHH